jgi:hypothetical protein
MMNLMTAAMIPMKLKPMAVKLINPPRILDDWANRIPITPDTRATPAKISPKNAPKLKLRIAATMATIDAVLTDALF